MKQTLNMQIVPPHQYVTDYVLFFNLENEQFHFIEPIVVYG